MFCLAVLACAGALLAPLALTAGPAHAGPAASLPERNTPTPTPVLRDADDSDDEPAGAWIELQAPGLADGGWAVVQWQDDAGGWHDVEGWRGTLTDGRQVWWVAAAHFGHGPFRWQVLDSPGGELLAESVPFRLPGAADAWVRISVVH
jgi:hypothetical protein